jgi:hypothetical protein
MSRILPRRGRLRGPVPRRDGSACRFAEHVLEFAPIWATITAMTDTSRRFRRCGTRAWSWSLCLALAVPCLAACSGAHSPSPSARHRHSTTASPSASAAPSTGAAALAVIKANWQEVFNGKISIPQRLDLLQNGQEFASFVHAQDKTSLGALVLTASAKVTSVKLESPGQASVVFTIYLSGKVLANGLHGMSVYSGGTWKVATTSFCSLLRLAYGKKSHVIPAACGS